MVKNTIFDLFCYLLCEAAVRDKRDTNIDLDLCEHGMGISYFRHKLRYYEINDLIFFFYLHELARTSIFLFLPMSHCCKRYTRSISETFQLQNKQNLKVIA